MSDQFASLIGEVDSLAKTLGDYANNVGSHLFNPANVLPHFSEVVGNIKMDQLVTTANEIADKAVTISSGAITQNLYRAAGVVREANLRTFNKASFYQRAQLELGSFSEEVVSEIGPALNRIRGSSPEQDVGV